jgi:predicted permease
LEFGGSVDFEETFWNNLFGKEHVSQIQKYVRTIFNPWLLLEFIKDNISSGHISATSIIALILLLTSWIESLSIP